MAVFIMAFGKPSWSFRICLLCLAMYNFATRHFLLVFHCTTLVFHVIFSLKKELLVLLKRWDNFYESLHAKKNYFSTFPIFLLSV